MSLSLVTISDGTTADAADVNQYKTAIETLAGAGWDDGAGDLDVEELSDAVKTPGDGLDYSGGNLVVDVSDFAGSGLEDDGSNDLRIAAAAAGDGLQGGGGSALAVDVSEFAGSGLEDDGSENLRIAAAAAGAGLTGGAGSALAVGAGDGIAVAANDVAVDLDGGADDGLEFSSGKLKATPATTSVKGVVELATSGEVASGVVVQGNDARLFRKVLYADNTVGGGSGSAAAALPEFAYDDPAVGTEIKIRTTYVHGQDGNGNLVLFCEGQVTADPSPNYARIYLQTTYDGVAFNSAYATITDYGSYGNYKVILDVSGLTTDVRYEVRVVLNWTGSPTSGETAQIRRCIIMTEA